MGRLHQISYTVLHTAPLFPVAAGLIVGIVLDGRLQPSVFVYVVLFALISALVLIRRIRTLIGPLLVLAASACVGGVLHLAAARTIPASSIERYTGELKRIARVHGVVVSEPRILDIPPSPFARWSYGSQRTAFLLKTESIEGLIDDIPVTGRVRVTVGEVVLDLRENEHVEVFGWLYRFQPQRNPGSFDWSSFYRRQGVVAGLRCNHRENVRRFDTEAPAQSRNFVTWLRTTVRGMLTDDLSTGTDEEASLLEAMILGHRSRLDRRLNDVFIRAGVVHFLAVSGTHVVVVMSFVWFVGRIFQRNKRQCAWLMMLTVCVYALIAEPRPPVLRATVIAVLFCASLLLRRPRARLNWISAAAVVLLLCDPVGVFDVGFQLSFAAVLGVTYITPAIRQAGPELRNLVDRVIFRRPFAEQDRQIVDNAIRQTSPLTWRARHAVQRFLLIFLAVSVGAWLAGMPVVIGHFNRVQPWGPISSVIVFPLIYVVMILGLIKIVVSASFPALSIIIAWLVTVADRFLIWIVEHLSSLPGASIPIATPSWWLIATFYVFLVLFAWAFNPRPRHLSGQLPPSSRTIAVPHQWLKLASLFVFALLIVTAVVWPYIRQPSDRLVVTVLSVGAGSAVVIELPDGRTVLNDAGGRSPYDVGRNTVVPFLRHRGIRRIDRVHVSHPNLDHFSGLPSILEEIDAGPIIFNPCFEPRSPPRSPARHLLDLLADRGHPVEILDPADRRWEFGGVIFELLSPLGDLDESISANETSTVMRLSYAGHSMLLTGDIEERTLRALLKREDLRAEVLVLPHHGSVEPTSKAFVDAVDARATIRSSHQRMDETFNGLQTVVGNTPLFNTADVGAVRVIIDETGVRVAGHRSSPVRYR